MTPWYEPIPQDVPEPLSRSSRILVRNLLNEGHTVHSAGPDGIVATLVHVHSTPSHFSAQL